MHILVFALTRGVTQEVQATLGDTVDRFTVATAWPDILSCLEDDHPDLVIIERTALAQLESATVFSLTQPGQWPPVIILDTPITGLKDGVELTQRLLQTLPPSYQIGELRIDTRKKRVGLGEHWVTLPPLQYRLLLTLARRGGEVVSYQELLRAVWGYDGDDNEARELLKVHIRQRSCLA
jgi:hypothetical protein